MDEPTLSAAMNISIKVDNRDRSNCGKTCSYFSFNTITGKYHCGCFRKYLKDQERCSECLTNFFR